MKRALYILGLLDDKDIDWLLSVGAKSAFANGTFLVREGVVSETMFILLEGSARISVGKRAIATLGVGEVIGEISLLEFAPADGDGDGRGQCLDPRDSVLGAPREAPHQLRVCRAYVSGARRLPRPAHAGLDADAGFGRQRGRFGQSGFRRPRRGIAGRNQPRAAGRNHPRRRAVSHDHGSAGDRLIHAAQSPRMPHGRGTDDQIKRLPPEQRLREATT